MKSIICNDCGKKTKARSSNKKYCPRCKKKRHLESNKKYFKTIKGRNSKTRAKGYINKYINKTMEELDFFEERNIEREKYY
jgi:predicted amidophosphoribosyltransferase